MEALRCREEPIVPCGLVNSSVPSYRHSNADLIHCWDGQLAPGSGEGPRFHPSGSRLLVSRFDGLHWIDLETGATESVPETGGAYAPAISPDGTMLAFSMSLFGNPDVFLLVLEDAGPGSRS